MMAARWLMPAVVAIPLLFQRGYAQTQERFDHWQHRELFPKCTSCHVSVENPAEALWPPPSACAECHDASIEDSVSWRHPSAPPRTNLRFTHRAHAEVVRHTTSADSLLD